MPQNQNQQQANEAARKAQEARDAERVQAEKQAQETGSYRVVCAGLSYSLPGEENPTEFALHGAHIDLDAKQAKRLIGLDAVVKQGEDAPVPMLVASSNPDNPFGGIPQVNPVEHAQRMMAEAHAAAAKAGAVQPE